MANGGWIGDPEMTSNDGWLGPTWQDYSRRSWEDEDFGYQQGTPMSAVPQVTGGSVTYQRRIRTGEYEHADMTAMISFCAPEGTDFRQVYDLAADAAISKVHETLGLKPLASKAIGRPPNTPVAAAEAGAAVMAETAADAKERKKRETKVKAEEAHNRGVVTDPSLIGGDPAADPLAVASAAPVPTGAVPATEVLQVTGVAASAQVDPLAVGPAQLPIGADTLVIAAAQADPTVVVEDLFSAPPVKITEAELMAAVSARNAEIKNPTAIRALIGTFVLPGQSARDIPETQRAAFLQRLKTVV